MPRVAWPALVDVIPQPPPAIDGATAVVTFIGHSTFLIQTAAGNILTDPMYSERAGPMNLVGPRPHPTCNHKIFTDHIAYYPIRSTVRPGVTGYWQINGRSNLSYDDRVRLDLAYIGGWSLALDLMILARTARVLVGRHGAV